MGKLIDLTGKRFGRWTVLKRHGYNNQGQPNWLCKCDCGAIKEVNGANLRRGKSVSCGCYEQEIHTTHGMTHSRLYRIWKNMIGRCNYDYYYYYKRYGGRGITVCDDWKKSKNFIKWSLENGYDDTLTIDRINVDGNYEPSNCRWVSMKEQCDNKTGLHLINYQGEEVTLTELSRRYGIHPTTLTYRLKQGMSIEEALSKKPNKHIKKKGDSV